MTLSVRQGGARTRSGKGKVLREIHTQVCVGMLDVSRVV